MVRKVDPDSYPCGHPRTEENSARVGRNQGVRCKICRRKIANRSAQAIRKRVWEERRDFVAWHDSTVAPYGN